MKMPKKISPNMFAPCGMNCMVCYKHCNTKKIKQTCPGCLNASNNSPSHCNKCKIKKCVNNKGIKYCYECIDFPCKLINSLDSSYNKRYNESLIDNSLIVKESGLATLMSLHTSKYQCKKCGGILSLHDKTCTECRD